MSTTTRLLLGVTTTASLLLASLAPADSIYLCNDDGILHVDLTTGNRTMVADASTGTGPSVAFSSGITAYGAGHLLVACGSRVMDVEIATGNRVNLTGAGVGTGFDIGLAAGMTLESSGTSALVADRSGFQAVFRVNLTTGDRAIMSGPFGNGTGTTFFNNYDVVDEPASVLVCSASGNNILRVDKTTGDRTDVTPFGISMYAFDKGTDGNLYSVNNGTTLVKIDLSGTPVSSPFSSNSIGTGPAYVAPRGIVAEPSGTMLVIDCDTDAVLRVNTTTGDRVVVSDDSTGTGPQIWPGNAVFATSVHATFISSGPTAAESWTKFE